MQTYAQKYSHALSKRCKAQPKMALNIRSDKRKKIVAKIKKKQKIKQKFGENIRRMKLKKMVKTLLAIQSINAYSAQETVQIRNNNN